MTDQTAISSDLRVEHVLVPLDGSELAQQAIPTARVLTKRFQAELQTISVAASTDQVERLRELATAALGVGNHMNRVHVEIGADPAERILGRARELEACVVCLTTHGRGRLEGSVFGSVARSILQRSSEPIVALGPLADNPGWSPRPRSWPEPLSVRRIVVCVDGTETSEQVLPLAISWAGALDMSVTILTVVEDAPTPFRPEVERSRFGPPVDAEAYIESLVRKWSRVFPGTDGEIARDPIGPASGIRVYLDRQPAGLLALTTHARSGMQRLRLGAQAASIVRASVAPCLVAPVVV